jgi:hypothetical protein
MKHTTFTFLLLTLLIPSVACGYEPPAYVYKGISVWFDDDLQSVSKKPVSKADFVTVVKYLNQYWWDVYEQPSRNAFEKAPIRVRFSAHPIECDATEAGLCSGLGGYAIDVWLKGSCLADSVLLHELVHALRQRKQHDWDIAHEDKMLWAFADDWGPEALRHELKGCAK